MMHFFRNREIRLFIALYIVVFAVSMAFGFMESTYTGILTLVVCITFGLLFFVFTKKRYNNIRVLAEQIDRVLHGSQSVLITESKEGELSVLQSELQKMTVALMEQTELLKRDKSYLSDSIADIAHQLRTPLTSVNMVVSFLSQDDISLDRRKELTRELSRLLSRIDWLITALLKISKIDAGTAEFRSDTVFVKELIAKAVEPLSIGLELNNINLEVHAGDEIFFIGDLQWSAEAIGNIIKNCMEQCPGGRISIECFQNSLCTEIAICDNGGGIDKQDLPHIFERFYRGKNASDESFGIGLALSRMILGRQNGTLKAENKNDGACFTVKFYKMTV